MGTPTYTDGVVPIRAADGWRTIYVPLGGLGLTVADMNTAGEQVLLVWFLPANRPRRLYFREMRFAAVNVQQSTQNDGVARPLPAQIAALAPNPAFAVGACPQGFCSAQPSQAPGSTSTTSNPTGATTLSTTSSSSSSSSGGGGGSSSLHPGVIVGIVVGGLCLLAIVALVVIVVLLAVVLVVVKLVAGGGGSSSVTRNNRSLLGEGY